MYELRWQVVWDSWPALVSGLALGLGAAIVAILAASLIGLAAAFARLSSNVLLRKLAGGYVEFIRNIPLLLIIFFVYFGLPTLQLGYLDEAGSLVLALSIYIGAYLTEIFRAGLLAVEKSYLEAGKSIGLTPWQVTRLIRFPMMFRIILPSLSNMFISTFKDTSLGAAISVKELTYAGMVINTTYWRVIEAWTSVAVIYLIFVYGLASLLRQVEKRYARWA